MIDVQIWMARPLEIDETELKQRLPLLSPEEQSKYHAFRFDKHRHHYLAAHLLLRKAISQYASLPYDKIKLSSLPHSKPYCETLVNGRTIEFSLTHTHGLVACAVADVPVGIDAEWIHRKWGHVLAEAVLTERELQHWQKTTPEDRSKRFFTLWTLKEAYVKGIGKGLSVPFKSIQLEVANPDCIGLELLDADAAEFRPQVEWKQVLLPTPTAEHVAALAIHSQGGAVGRIEMCIECDLG